MDQLSKLQSSLTKEGHTKKKLSVGSAFKGGNASKIGLNKPPIRSKLSQFSQTLAIKRQELKTKLNQRLQAKVKEREDSKKAKQLKEKEDVKELRRQMSFKARKSPSFDKKKLSQFLNSFVVSKSTRSFCS